MLDSFHHVSECSVHGMRVAPGFGLAPGIAQSMAMALGFRDWKL